ncbi:restriction endonuclease subunit S [Vibrio harveyi]
MEVIAGYKQTEIGVFPDDWEVCRIDELGDVIRGASPRPKGDPRYYGGDVPRLMVEDITRDKHRVIPSVDFLTEEGAKHSRLCKKGTLALVCSGTPSAVGLPAVLDIDACIHDGILALINPRKNIDVDFLFHVISSCQTRLYNAATHGGTFVNLTTDAFKAFKVFIPVQKSEQAAIAKALSDVDALIESLDELIAKKVDLKKAAMRELLTGNTRLSGFESEWSLRCIGDFTDCTAGGTPNTQVADYWGGDIRWMSSGELNLKRVNEVDGRITSLGLKESSTKLIPPNCVLIGLAGQGKTRGTVAMNLVELCTNQSIAAIFPNDTFVPEFLYFNLDSRYDELRGMSTGDGGRGGLNLKIIRSIEIPFPTFDEQQAIADVLIDMDAEIEALEQRRNKTLDLKQGMMQELLSGKTRLINKEIIDV